MPQKALILEHSKTLNEIIISGSYWFRIEMAYGLKRLGFIPSLVQHPNYNFAKWINGVKFSSKKEISEIKNQIEEFDLVILLEDIPLKGKLKSTSTSIIYWDIEGFPNSDSFFEGLVHNIKENEYEYYGAKFNSAKKVISRFQYHLKKQQLQFWEVSRIFSAAKNPLIKESIFLPLAAEPELYNEKDNIRRDIILSLIGSTSRWFQAKQRIEIAKKVLKKFSWPLAYWYGAMPEIEKNNMPKNCYPMGHLDFFSLPYFLQRSKMVLHIPRPYHLDSGCQSVTIFQAAAAGAIPIHLFGDLKEANEIGYNYQDISELENLKQKKYPENHTYKSRFKEAMEKMGVI